eukprot:gb/GECH01012967.1/.p1 GENE.gb/GECH01012967.1/~~gb/GECH01012967.1/.p1  ORF type:complete len:709 (+),score=100.26 gb/GECH01012967.1/:1-2127(+)
MFKKINFPITNRLFLVCFLIWLIIPFRYARSQFFPSEVRVLKKLCFSGEWCHSLGWKQEKFVCTWRGIKCENNHVIELDLENEMLLGEIPKEVKDLKYLRKLNLARNVFTSTIPSEIVTLRFLKELDLSDNKLTGLVPNSLSDKVNTTKIQLHGNQFNCPLPQNFEYVSCIDHVDALPLLEFCKRGRWCHRQDWNEEFDPCFWKGIRCKNGRIHSISVKGTTFRGLIPRNIHRLKKLKHINFQDNSFSGSIPKNLYLMKQLETLNLKNNRFRGRIAPQIRKLENLKVLDLSNNRFSFFPEVKKGLPSLQYLDLSFNRLHGTIKRLISQSWNLTHVYVQDNLITGNLPQLPPPRLTKYNFDSNSISCPIPEWAPKIDHCDPDEAVQALVEMCRSGNWCEQMEWSVRTNPCQFWKGITCLNGDIIEIIIGNNNFRGEIPKTISKITKLELLDLSLNHFSGTLPESISELDRLSGLYLFSNQFSGEIPESIEKLSKLKDLHLDDNLFSGPLPIGLFDMTSLEELNLSNNFFTGSIPPEIKSLHSLKFLKISHNNFSGPVPIELHRITAGKEEAKYNFFSCPLPKWATDLWHCSNHPDEIPLLEFCKAGSGWCEKVEWNYGSDPCLWEGITCFHQRVTEILLPHLNQEQVFVPKRIQNLKNLEKIDLGTNLVMGELPHTLISLKNLTTITMSSDLFHGEITNDLQKFVELKD